MRKKHFPICIYLSLSPFLLGLADGVQPSGLEANQVDSHNHPIQNHIAFAISQIITSQNTMIGMA